MHGHTAEQPVPDNKVCVCGCWGWVGAGIRPPIVAAVLAVTRGESTHTHTHHKITDPVIRAEPFLAV